MIRQPYNYAVLNRLELFKPKNVQLLNIGSEWGGGVSVEIDLSEFRKKFASASGPGKSIDQSIVIGELADVLTVALKSLCEGDECLEASAATVFAKSSSAKIAKNLLDPALDIKKVTVNLDVSDSGLTVSFTDDGKGFDRHKVPNEKPVSARAVLGIDGHFARGKSTKTKGDGSAGGCGRGFAQIVDWYSVIGEPNGVTLARPSEDGGCTVSFHSEVARNDNEKDIFERVREWVLGSFSSLSEFRRISFPTRAEELMLELQSCYLDQKKTADSDSDNDPVSPSASTLVLSSGGFKPVSRSGSSTLVSRERSGSACSASSRGEDPSELDPPELASPPTRRLPR